jgi:hypothetical protein
MNKTITQSKLWVRSESPTPTFFFVNCSYCIGSNLTRDSLSSNIDTLLSILNFEMFAIISMFLCLHLSNAFTVNYYSNHKSMALHMITPKDAFDIGEIALSFVSYIDSDKEWMKSLEKFRKKIVSPLANRKSSFD